MSAPSPLLLLWCGLAATLAAAITGIIIGNSGTATWTLAPRPRSRSHALSWSLAAGLLAYPIAYGFTFELLHRADLRTGALLGAVHGVIMFLLAEPRTDLRAALRAAGVHLVYGAAIAFLYVTP